MPCGFADSSGALPAAVLAVGSSPPLCARSEADCPPWAGTGAAASAVALVPIHGRGHSVPAEQPGALPAAERPPLAAGRREYLGCSKR